ncbi:MAG: site-specific integrase [Candidatus Thiodiazotropha sp. (ex. Lucinisca nassula)]|nr:site-specific integrase [Candidatus Thiodiazotropha sp. (ex. Lucinisca nassula)]
MAHKLNDKQIKGLLKAGEPGRHAVGGGLYFRISRAGTGWWVYRYTINGRRREYALEAYGTNPGEMGLADAASKAAHIRADVKNGIDPLAEKKRTSAIKIRTVGDLAADWIADLEKRLEHPRIPRRSYERFFKPKVGELSLDRISPLDIRDILQSIDAPTVANDALMYAKQLFNHGMRLGVIESNPAAPFTVKEAGGVEQSRDRALEIEELETLFSTMRKYNDQITRENYLAMALLVIFAVRKSELIAAPWHEFDLKKGKWELPAHRTKSNRAIDIPIPEAAIQWLQELKIRAGDSDYVFPKRRASKRFPHMSPDTLNAAILKLFRQGKLEIEHHTIHDMRRTSRTLMSKAGVASHIAERCLNHKIPKVEGTYDRWEYFDERREAHEKIADLLSPIVNKKAA